MSNPTDAAKEQVWATLRALNDAWTKGDPAQLAEYFHPEMVAVTATDRDPLRGRAACLASWQGFAAAATVREWREIDPDIRLHGDCALVSYAYQIVFEMAGQTIATEGRDLFVFILREGRWWAVADHFSAYPA